MSAVKHVAGHYSLEIEWSNGKHCTVDLFKQINDFEVLKPLQNLAVFSRVTVGDWGLDLTWGNEVELSASTLYRFA
ncbi:DUF2442 domain-containing protein [Pseudomonas sp. L1(2025)]|uniref:DUF2442 domain-containing protein n=1 Tax=Pseudomonas sp. L1(2025) TaxID=3449429 RepID=UPI003F691F16